MNLKAIALASALLCNPVSADVIYLDNNLQLNVVDNTLYIDGLLLENSFYTIRNAIINNDVEVVYLNSYGGITLEAHLLGLFFREFSLTAIVRERDVCASACALVLLGAENVVIDGYVAFHSSYYASFPYTHSLSDIYIEGGVEAARLLEYVITLGYSYKLGTNIVNLTTPTTYMLFDDETDLLQYRTEDVVSVPEREFSLFSIVNEAELLALAQQ